MTDSEYNECLEATVVRRYIMKGYSLEMYRIAKLCTPGQASLILNKYKLIRPKSDFKPGKWMRT